MITKHSIDLTRVNDPCCGLIGNGEGCRILIQMDEHCGTWRCPFYKPQGCKDWIRIKDRTGINLIPPEDWRR